MSGQFNRLYPSFLGALLRAEVDVEAVDLKLVLVSATYVYDAADTVLDDVDGQLATSAALTSVTVSGPEVSADPATFGSVGPGADVEAAVLFVDSGDSSTSQLVAFYARKADTVPLVQATDGGAVTLSWPSALLKI